MKGNVNEAIKKRNISSTLGHIFLVQRAQAPFFVSRSLTWSWGFLCVTEPTTLDCWMDGRKEGWIERRWAPSSQWPNDPDWDFWSVQFLLLLLLFHALVVKLLLEGFLVVVMVLLSVCGRGARGMRATVGRKIKKRHFCVTEFKALHRGETHLGFRAKNTLGWAGLGWVHKISNWSSKEDGPKSMRNN